MNKTRLMKINNFYLVIIVLFFQIKITSQIINKPQYLNPSLSLNERIDDLISRLTLEEKVSQMINESSAIPRLNIPGYSWWNEALHGVARAGIATVFPQAIGLAATWDDNLIYKVADIISTEARAKYHEGIRKNDRTQFKGLTIWSPNINIFRDPRWGRGQETYGEDPFLTSKIGLAFVKGLQGNNPKYFKTISTPKHFAVHSGPEKLRHQFNAVISKRDLEETYLPAFKTLVEDGKAYSVMGAYNSYMNEPCCANKILLDDILRDKWHFTGYVVSDCGAINDIWKNHKYVSTPAEAAAVAVRAGCDLNCGQTYLSLVDAVKKGLISENEIDRSLKRLFKARYKLGLFDPPDSVLYSNIPFSENNTEEHRKAALKTARESIVLLKNENNILPLNKNLKTIAVIGPNADDENVMFGNYNGLPSKAVTPLEGIKNTVSENTKILYAKGCNWLTPSNKLQVVTQNLVSTGDREGLHAEYFNNIDLSGKPVYESREKNFNINWIKTPPPKIGTNENFSVRWTGKIKMNETGKYIFSISADDGFRLFIDDKIILDAWQSQPVTTLEKEVSLIGNKKYDIKIEYFQAGGDALFKFQYTRVTNYDPFKDAENIASESDAVIFFGGISPSLEGEEMSVNFDGFDGGDRTNIKLPSIQDSLLKTLYLTGKPIVLVLMSGSALAVNWADEKLHAIVQSWYPGEEGGNAIADVLFGEYNPAGRLPVTFYKSVDQLPPFEDYDMEGRTYKYFKKEPLYPFGFGLSYSKFQYTNLQVPKKLIIGDSLIVKVDVKNSSDLDGDEVVQLYISCENSFYKVPIRSLKDFKRIHLNAGETQTIKFTLIPKQLAIVNNDGKRILVPSKLKIFVGGGQPDQSEKFKIPTLTSEIVLVRNNE